MARRWLAETGTIGTSTACSGIDLVGLEIHVVLALVLVAANAKADRDALALADGVKEGAFLFGQLQFDVLRILIVRGDDKFSLYETTGKRLGGTDEFDRAFELIHERRLR